MDILQDNPFRVIVAGSRTFTDYKLLKTKCDKILERKANIFILSGTARGADRLGEKYAREHNIPVRYFPAEWDIYNKAAGFIRNKEMAMNADALIVFWNGRSGGTRHMIDIAKEQGLQIRVVVFK